MNHPRKVLSAVFILLFIVSRLYANDKIEIVKIKEIEFGPDKNQLFFNVGSMPWTGRIAFVTKEGDVFFYENGKRRIIVFDNNFNIKKEISIESIDVLSISSIVSDKKDNYYISDQEEKLKCFDSTFNKKYAISRTLMGVRYVSLTKCYAVDGYYFYFRDDGELAVVDPNGNVKMDDEVVKTARSINGWCKDVLQNDDPSQNRFEAFIESNQMLCFHGNVFFRDNDALAKYHEFMRAIGKLREAPQSDAGLTMNDILRNKLLVLMGYGVNSDFYYGFATRIYVFNKTGGLIHMIDVDGKPIKQFNVVAPNGDILSQDYSDNEFSFTQSPRSMVFSRITNSWDPIESNDGSSISVATVGLSMLINLFATSTLTEPVDKNAYHPVKLFDGDPKTMWIENAKGPGIGENVTVGFYQPITVDEIQVMPGCFWPEYWKQNCRVKNLEIVLDGKPFADSFADEMVLQSMKLDPPMTFKTATFTIKDVYLTTNWEDTAISEIAFYYKGTKIEVDYSKYKDFLKTTP